LQTTTISRQAFNQLDEQAKQEGTTPEAILGLALEQFIKDNE
jgi:hypothetical protein